MPGAPHETHARASRLPREDGRTANARSATPKTESGAARDTTRPDGAKCGGQHGRGERGPSDGPQVALHDLFRGLRAGDLESVLLTVAMAAEENRMPCAHPDEDERILGFLARLAEHDAALPPPPDGAGVRLGEPLDGTGAEDGAPAPQ